MAIDQVTAKIIAQANADQDKITKTVDELVETIVQLTGLLTITAWQRDVLRDMLTKPRGPLTNPVHISHRNGHAGYTATRAAIDETTRA